MFPYYAKKDKYLYDFEHGHLISHLDGELQHTLDEQVDIAEIASWRNSSAYVFIVLNHPDVPDTIEIGMEYVAEQIQGDRPKRVDAVLAGYNSEHEKCMILLELKQYSNLEYKEEEPDQDKKFVNVWRTLEKKCNPFYQIDQYREMISQYNSMIYDTGDLEIPDGIKKDNIKRVVFFHNLNKNKLDDLTRRKIEETEYADAVFFEGEIGKFRNYVIENVGADVENDVLKFFNKGEPPAGKFEDILPTIFRGEFESGRRDQRKCADELKALIDGESRKIVLVKGGPGSGKSVVALQLFKHCIDRGIDVKFLVGGSAFLNYLKVPLNELISEDVRSRFMYPKYCKTAMEGGDFPEVIIWDELHRSSAEDFHDVFLNQGEENRARLLIAFFDEYQIYRSDCLREEDLRIEEICANNAWGYETYTLDSQFRCHSDQGYLSWLERKLYNRDSEVKRSNLIFDFDVIDSKEELCEMLRDATTHYVVLGGLLEGENNPDKNIVFQDIGGNDMVIHSYENYKVKYKKNNGVVLPAERSVFVNNTIIDAEMYYGDLNCIQGVETENAIVIIGNELIYDGNMVRCSEEAYDSELLRQKLLGLSVSSNNRSGENNVRDLTDEEKNQLEKYLKNIYKVLLTRAFKTCRVYCRDERLRDFLKEE